MDNLLRRLASTLITTGLLLAMLGSSQQMRPVSDQRVWQDRSLNHTESQFAELHRQLQLAHVCLEISQTDPAVWDNWPCSEVRLQAG